MQINNLDSNQNVTIPTTHDQQPQLIKKKSILNKKKKVPERLRLLQNVALKHVVNIGDICYMNSDALRNPDCSQQSLLTSVYHYNMISKISFNKNIVNLELKRNYDNFLPPQYFIERLRSFGDKQMANVAEHLQKINYQFSTIKDSCPTKNTSFNRQKEQLMLKNFMANRQGRKFFLFFSQITPEKITMKNIIFSVPLLEALGYDVDTMSTQFIKYKHVFFEVFTAKNYGYFLQECYEKFFQIQAQIMEKPDMNQDERRKLTQILYQQEVIRKIPEKSAQYQEIIPAKVAWFSPHPSICCFEILDMNQVEVQKKTKRLKLNDSEGVNQDQNYKILSKYGISITITDDSQIESRTSETKSSEENVLKEGLIPKNWESQQKQTAT